MRQWLVLAVLTPPAITLLMMVLMRLPLVRFRREVPLIRTGEDLARMKHVATGQMYAALIALALMPVPLFVWLYGHFMEGQLGWLDLLLLVVAPFVLLGILAGRLGGPAREVRAIAVAAPDLQAERDHVVDVWSNRMLPDW